MTKLSRSRQAGELTNKIGGLSSSSRRLAPLEQHLNNSGPGSPVFEHVGSSPEQAARHIFSRRMATERVGEITDLSACGSLRGLSKLQHQVESIYQLIQVIGEEGILVNDYVPCQKLRVLDLATCNRTPTLAAAPKREA